MTYYCSYQCYEWRVCVYNVSYLSNVGDNVSRFKKVSLIKQPYCFGKTIKFTNKNADYCVTEYWSQ